MIGIRDSDTGGDILHPESEGLLETFDLWMKWYGHADSNSVRFGRRQSAVLRTHRFTPILEWRKLRQIMAQMPPRGTKPSPTHNKASKTSGADFIDKGLTNDAEIDKAIAAWETWGSNPDAMYLRC